MKRQARQWRSTSKGQEVQCASCHNFLPATRDHYYFHRKPGGDLKPHSWCKPCYASNSGRAAGMRCKAPVVAEAPADLVRARDRFLAMPAAPADRASLVSPL